MTYYKYINKIHGTLKRKQICLAYSEVRFDKLCLISRRFVEANAITMMTIIIITININSVRNKHIQHSH